ncbi:NADH-ubiquinone oxidoreductase-F iron-sulfur binding region domain-containing protein [Stenotrophomonas sp. MMGLT7]|uniref:complex I 51 kDa subunit family protein n=1 Tax=Stenotrophomonas sp. MMGLT7 TaxID=2901227 RepID=UPI001E3495A7|nr:NADH-ubiquinone oxidoreductase-F iron-sulfur binding region domain-containing protein [Stenotrophomonas sp. MMGLT7]MCD7097056.1 SLBB domain-containing protein [Stenotrophomonas sp. MMGLT7]
MHEANQLLLHPSRQVGADLYAWFAAGGGEGLNAALADPAAIIPLLRDAGLRGMGGAGFPTWRKWEATAVAGTPGCDRYVVCNANEDEPGTFKDRHLLRWTPHQVIEGALIAALAVDANHVVLYVNPHQEQAIAEVRKAVGQWRGSEPLGRLEKRLGRPLQMEVVATSGRYIGGEETAVISWLEGNFPFPRRKPPFPAESGVAGAPTLLNNAETLANVPHILRNGADWYRALGLGEAVGTKLYSLSGDVLQPGLYELPMGTSLQSLIFDHGGGMLEGKAFKAVFTGGPSNTLLTAADLDVALDFDSVRQRRSRLGTGAMIVVSEGTSIVRRVAEYIEFFAAGSCGQCPPCKCGTFQMARLLDRLDTGHGTVDDLRALQNLCRILPGSGRCGLIDGAVTVVESSLHTFPQEYGLARA